MGGLHEMQCGFVSEGQRRWGSRGAEVPAELRTHPAGRAVWTELIPVTPAWGRGTRGEGSSLLTLHLLVEGGQVNSGLIKYGTHTHTHTR